MNSKRNRSWLWAIIATCIGLMLYSYDDIFDDAGLKHSVLHYIATTIEVLLLGPGIGLLAFYLSENLHLRHTAVARERARAQQQRFLALGRIAASVAHEVRNPLHNIRLIMDEIKEQQEFPKQHPLCDRVEANLERINRAVTLVYQLAKPTGLELAQENKCDVNDVVKETLLNFEKSGIQRFRFKNENENQKIAACSVGHLRIILDNLIRNALAASSEDIDIRIDTIDNTYAIVVANVGTLPEGIAAMMDEGSSNTMVGGLGLGLFISHHLALQAGAELRLQQLDKVVEASLIVRKGDSL